MHVFAQKPQASQRTRIAKPARPSRGPGAQSPQARSIVQVRRPSGNQAVQRMLRTVSASLEAVLTRPASIWFGRDFSRIPIDRSAAEAAPAKLAINEPGDGYEQEADRMAEQVMRMSEPRLQRARPGGGGCNGGAEQPGREQESLRTKRIQASDTGEIAAPPVVHEVLRSPGRPLDPATRAFMEPRFGCDFSRVRVHDDGTAAKSARDVSAKAYAVGHDIVFGTGQFAPGTHQGRGLLAHELAHVTQQNGGMAGIQRTPAGDKLESRNEVTARQRGRAIAARMKKEGKLSEASRAQLTRDLQFFEGTAWEAYVNTVRPALRAVTEIDMETPAPVLTALASAVSQTFLPAVQGVKEFLPEKRPEDPEALKVIEARKAFRARHGDHGADVLNHIDNSLAGVTSNNLPLLLAYYRYYAEHELTDELPRNMSEDMYTGATSGGDTDINPAVLSYEKTKFPTNDPITLLGGTLIHEYSHIPQDNPQNPIFEGKAYGIEWYFAERSKDDARANSIANRHSREKRDVKNTFYFSYYTMRELYKVIDGDEPAAKEARGVSVEEAREMSVEYISKNTGAYRPKLAAIFSEVSKWYVP